MNASEPASPHNVPGVNSPEIAQLRLVIESQHGGRAALIGSARVHETKDALAAWDGLVHVFSLAGHGGASRAYAWSAGIRGETGRRFFAVLHQGKVNGPLPAMRAALEAMRATQVAKPAPEPAPGQADILEV